MQLENGGKVLKKIYQPKSRSLCIERAQEFYSQRQKGTTFKLSAVNSFFILCLILLYL